MATYVKVPRKGGGFRHQAVVRKAGHRAIKKTFDRKEDARAWAERQEMLILAKRYRDPRLAEMFNLGEALGKYREDGFLRKKAASTMDREIYSRRHLERLLGAETALAYIDSAAVNTYQHRRIQEGASNSSIRQELSMLSKMFNLARKAWSIPVENPVDDIERIPPGAGRDRFLSTEEAELVIEESRRSRNPAFYPFVLLLMHTGMRTGEAARLQEVAVNLEARSVRITRTKSGRPRNVPLTTQAVAALKEISLQAGGYYFLRPGHRASRHIMLRPGSVFHHCWIHLWKRLTRREDVNVPYFRPHDIRHTAASHLLMAGVDVRVIADILGHSTLQMVMRYTHLHDSHRQSVIEKIGYLGGDNGQTIEDPKEESYLSSGL